MRRGRGLWPQVTEQGLAETDLAGGRLLHGAHVGGVHLPLAHRLSPPPASPRGGGESGWGEAAQPLAQKSSGPGPGGGKPPKL